MSLLTQVSVYAMTPGTTFSPPRLQGIESANVRNVNQVRDSDGNWIGKMNPPPSNASFIYSEIEVGRDKITSETIFYYSNRTVAQMISDIG